MSSAYSTLAISLEMGQAPRVFLSAFTKRKDEWNRRTITRNVLKRNEEFRKELFFKALREFINYFLNNT